MKMNELEFNKQKKAIWANYEKELGRPIPREIRKIVESDITLTDHDEFLADLDADISGRLELIRYHLDKLDNASVAAVKPKNKKTYPRPFEKRLHLVNFIATISLDNLERRSFTPHTRIKWKEKCQLWNKEHPHDCMTRSTLKRDFFRAIKQEDLVQEFFKRKEKEIRLLFMPLREAVEGLRRRSHPMRELVQKTINGQHQLVEVLNARIKQLEINEKAKGERP
jgi:hypothetical protein